MIDLIERFPLFIIFLLVLIISANFLGKMFPSKFRNLLDNNIYIKYLFIFLIIIFFVVLESPIEYIHLDHIIIDSIIFFIFFILLIKVYYKIFTLVLLFLFLMYLLFVKKNEYKNDFKIKNEKSEVESEDIKKYEKNIDILQNINMIILIIIFILVIIGLLYNIYLKKQKYKNKFNIITFLFSH